jgi:hypothetical protein
MSISQNEMDLGEDDELNTKKRKRGEEDEGEEEEEDEEDSDEPAKKKRKFSPPKVVEKEDEIKFLYISMMTSGGKDHVDYAADSLNEILVNSDDEKFKKVELFSFDQRHPEIIDYNATVVSLINTFLRNIEESILPDVIVIGEFSYQQTKSYEELDFAGNKYIFIDKVTNGSGNVFIQGKNSTQDSRGMSIFIKKQEEGVNRITVHEGSLSEEKTRSHWLTESTHNERKEWQQVKLFEQWSKDNDHHKTNSKWIEKGQYKYDGLADVLKSFINWAEGKTADKTIRTRDDVILRWKPINEAIGQGIEVLYKNHYIMFAHSPAEETKRYTAILKEGEKSSSIKSEVLFSTVLAGDLNVAVAGKGLTYTGGVQDDKYITYNLKVPPFKSGADKDYKKLQEILEIASKSAGGKTVHDCVLQLTADLDKFEMSGSLWPIVKDGDDYTLVTDHKSFFFKLKVKSKYVGVEGADAYVANTFANMNDDSHSQTEEGAVEQEIHYIF